MSVLNYPAVLSTFCDFAPAMNENVVFSKMFDHYLESVSKPEVINKSIVSKIKSGEKQLEQEGKLYYADELSQKEMMSDIEDFILPSVSDKFGLCKKLKDLVLADSMENGDRERLLASYPKDNGGVPKFLSDIIIFSLNRPVKKHALSPIMSERINLPAVASCKYFCGRKNELQAFSEMLETHDKIFIQGIGGIGKSELIKKFIKDNKSAFTNILFLTFSESLMNTVAGIPFKNDSKEEKVGELYSAHLDFLRYMREDTLIIIDNFDIIPETDSSIDDIMELNCKIVFTTRCDVGGDYDVFKLGEIEKSSLFEMAEQLKLNIEDRETLDKIFGAVHYHTLACELIIRLLKKSAVTPETLLDKLLKYHVDIDITDKIRKDESLQYKEHIHNLFRLFALSDEQKNTMLFLSLIPAEGISDKYFMYLTGCGDMNIINELDEIGLVIYDEHLIQVHPLIGEAAASDFKPDMDNCRLFIEQLNRELTNHSLDFENHLRQAVILEIADRVVEFCGKNDVDFYFFFLINACPYAETFEDKERMGRYISEMEKYLPEATDRYSKAVYLMCKAAYAVLFENDIDAALKHTTKAYNLIPHVVGGGGYTQREIVICYNVNNNLGLFYLKKGNDRNAKKYLKAARDIQLAYESLLDPEDMYAHLLSVAKLLNNTERL